MGLCDSGYVTIIAKTFQGMGRLGYSPYDDYFYLYMNGKDHFFFYKFKREDIDRIDDYSIRLRR